MQESISEISPLPTEGSTLIDATDSAQSTVHAVTEVSTAAQEGEEVEVQGAANSPALEIGSAPQQQLAPETVVPGMDSIQNPCLPLCSTCACIGTPGMLLSVTLACWQCLPILKSMTTVCCVLARSRKHTAAHSSITVSLLHKSKQHLLKLYLLVMYHLHFTTDT